MPINPVSPPTAAVAAFNRSLAMLAGANDRFAALGSDEVPWLLPHPVMVSHIDTLAVDGAWRTGGRSAGSLPIWRFFVSSVQIPVGVIELTPRVGVSFPPKVEYEFLALREGRPVELAARTFRNLETSIEPNNAYSVQLLKAPGLYADFYWLRRPDLHGNEQLDNSWMVPIFEGLAGLVPGRPYRSAEAFEILSKESQRVLGSEFVQKLASRDQAEGQEPLTL